MDPHRKASREQVYAAIDTERDYQDRTWRDQEIPEINNRLTIGEFILLLEEYAAKARAAWAVEPKPEVNALDIMRKCAGIAVNCMEQHGAPKRED